MVRRFYRWRQAKQKNRIKKRILQVLEEDRFGATSCEIDKLLPNSVSLSQIHDLLGELIISGEVRIFRLRKSRVCGCEGPVYWTRTNLQRIFGGE